MLGPLIALVFTLPTFGQLRTIIPPEQRAHPADSIAIECSGGPTIHELQTARLYWSPLIGGGWRMAQEHAVYGREGQPDTFQVVDGGHYYVTATNPAGESCASNIAYVLDLSVTGVDPGAPSDRISRSALFDVHGRRVEKPAASGIYFRRVWYESGRVSSDRVVVLK